jgi:glucose/arabinose dehydrogenase
VEQGGLIRIVQDKQLLSEPFLDLSSKVGSATWEQGLLSVAFHPDYEENGRFFVYYVASDDARSVIAEYRASAENPNQADTTETVLLEAANSEGIHYGGQLQFGSDGYLYISLGEGGYPRPELEPGATVTQKPPQNLASLHGSILRLDIDSTTVDSTAPYAIPADNPFANKAGARGEIWAYGLRNPWRFSFDRETGEMYLGDVGYQSAEELNVIRKGANYGWPITEGPACYVQSFVGRASCTWHKLRLRLQEPLAHYRFGVRRTAEDGEDAGVGSSSVTAGYVYRGKAFPSLRGQFFAADFVFGYVWALDPKTKPWQVKDALKTDSFFSSFGEDEDGELYLLDWAMGNVYQIVGSREVASN